MHHAIGVAVAALCATIEAHKYTDSFFPELEEYDFGVLDPQSLHGAPLGGYARSTASRLAKLPLPLPPSLSDVALEDFVPQYTTSVIRDTHGRAFVCRVYHEDELEASSLQDSMFDVAVLKTQAAAQGEVMHKKSKSSASKSSSKRPKKHDAAGPRGIGVSERDGQASDGATTEDGGPRPQPVPLDPKTFSEVAVGADDPLPGDGVDQGDVNHDQQGGEDASQQQNQQQNQQQREAQMQEEQQQNQQQRQQEQQPNDPQEQKRVVDNVSITSTQKHMQEDFVTKVAAVSQRLAELEGVCAQTHRGWWSYEWCHSNKMSQFHIHINESPRHRELEIQDVTNLGIFDRRIIFITELADDDPRKPNVATSRKAATITVADGQIIRTETVRRVVRNHAKQRHLEDEHKYDPLSEGIAKVTDIFIDGDVCPETGKPRRTEVTVRCCSEETMKQFKAGVLIHNQPLPEPIAGIPEPVAEKKGVCSYDVTVCTRLLCAKKGHEREVPHLSTLRNSRQRAQQGEESLVSFRSDENLDVAEMTVQEVLEATFGGGQAGCLQVGTGGWWVYELCFKKHLRQFHETTVMDRMTGATSSEVDTQHYLGFDAHFRKNPELDKIADEIRASDGTDRQTADGKDTPTRDVEQPDEAQLEDWEIVVNATHPFDLHLGKAKDSKTPNMGGSNSRRNMIKGKNKYGGNGAYFPIEYTHGDACEHPDVTDSAIKAGEVGKGGIERATSVRFYCGPAMKMNVKEDSTCHYIADVSIPLLCEHPLFRAPIQKREVVKCLPVD